MAAPSLPGGTPDRDDGTDAGGGAGAGGGAEVDGAVGALLGSVVTGRIVRALGIGPAYALSCVLFPAPLMLVPLADGPRPVVLGLLFLAEFGAGFGVMLLDITVGSIHAAAIPHRLRARVAGAFRTVNYGVRPLGALAGGGLGTAIGLRPTLWIATAGALLGVLWLLPSPLLRLRELPAPDEASASGAGDDGTDERGGRDDGAGGHGRDERAAEVRDPTSGD